MSLAIRNLPFVSHAPGRLIPWRIGDTTDVGEVQVLAEGADTGLHCTVSILELPAGAVSRVHTHLLEDEAFYVLDGRVELAVPDAELEVTAGPGEVFWQPRNLGHGFRVGADAPARLLQLLLPGTRLVPDLFLGILERGTPRTDEEVAELRAWLRHDLGMLLGPSGLARAGGTGVPRHSAAATAGGLTWHLRAADTLGVAELVELRLPARELVAALGSDADVALYVLGGTLAMDVAGLDGDTTLVAARGDVVWLPRGVRREVIDPVATEVTALALLMPGIGDQHVTSTTPKRTNDD